MNWLVSDYIKYYEDVVPKDVCENIMDFELNFQPSTYANSKGKTGNSDERVRMDECWIKNDLAMYISSDEEIIALMDKIGYLEVVIKYIDGVIKSIDNRGWDVSHAIGWKKFEAGMV